MAANIDILYEDNHLIIINKPAGLPSQGDLTTDACAIDLVKDYIKKEYKKPGNVYAGLVHRIDRPVSGVLMLCKTSKALTRMSEQFKNRSIKKTYLAVTHKPFNHERRHLEHHLIKDRRRNISKVVHPRHKKGKHAELYVESVSKSDEYTLLRVSPITGRSHQIRVQLSAVGYPIVGDVKYRGQKHADRRGICLHSHELTFHHPTTKEEITVRCLPDQSHWRPYEQLLAHVEE